MAKFKFADHPKTFSHTVKVGALDGTKQELKVSFIYRTRKAFGELFDTFMKANKNDTDTSEFSMAALMERTQGSNAQYLLKVLDSWELEEPLNEENVQRLCDEYPAVATAILDSYRGACLEGKLGN